jgi:hypothetical protein
MLAAAVCAVSVDFVCRHGVLSLWVICFHASSGRTLKFRLLPYSVIYSLLSL